MLADMLIFHVSDRIRPAAVQNSMTSTTVNKSYSLQKKFLRYFVLLAAAYTETSQELEPQPLHDFYPLLTYLIATSAPVPQQ